MRSWRAFPITFQKNPPSRLTNPNVATHPDAKASASRPPSAPRKSVLIVAVAFIGMAHSLVVRSHGFRRYLNRVPGPSPMRSGDRKIGRASCRESVCQDVANSEGAVQVNKKDKKQK